jgi:GNAT superfamily N-acetyltransferase
MELALHGESESIEREACRDLFAGAGAPELRRRLGLSAEDCGPALVLRSPALDHVLFNRALGLPRGGPDADALAESVIARYRAQGIARYELQVLAGTDPSVTCQRLQALGLHRKRPGFCKLVRGRQALPAASSALRAERAGKADAQPLGALIAGGLDLPETARELLAGAARGPRWHGYLVRDALGTPYAGLLMYAHAQRAFLALAATDPRQRRRGAERALIAQAVQDALDLGCRELAAETSEALPGHARSSFDNLTHNGFAAFELYDNWTPAGA